MNCQIAVVTTSVRTHFTCERLLASVGAHVLLQIASCFARVATILTCEWLLASMSAHVRPKLA